MRPPISVVMAVWNGEPYLRAAVDSILHQDFEDFEFIIVDDGSTDNTAAILDTYEDPRIVRMKNDANLGLAKSLNRGLDAARGTYIARQDADDVSLPDRFAKQLKFLEEHQEICILGTGCRLIDDADRPGAISLQPQDDLAIRWQMLFANAFFHTSVMVRRSILEENGLRYDQTIRFSQDFDLWARTIEQANGANLSDPLVELRIHDDSVSRRHSDAQIEIAETVTRRQLSTLFGEDPLPYDNDIARVRLWYYGIPDHLPSNELAAGRLFLDALDRFNARYPASNNMTRSERQNWTDRLLYALPWKAWKTKTGLALVFAIVRTAPRCVLRHLARRLVRGRENAKWRRVSDQRLLVDRH